MILMDRGKIILLVMPLMLVTVSASPAARQTNAARQTAAPSKPLLVAHRGASGYAPEHTLAAFSLAISQGADFVEQDLHVTKDGHLICLHDPDLARTTNVSELFADRARERDPYLEGKPERGWYAVDFTLAEIKRLEAASWFYRANPFATSPAFTNERVPTLQEAIEAIGDRAGLYIEIKNYEFYKSLGYDVVEKLAAALRRNGFERESKSDRVFIQSFSKECLIRMRDRAPRYARIQLLPMEIASRKDDTAKVTPALAGEVAGYAQGVGPSKTM
ncbi:MAG TPA: glycerophosphodiester phosphodiesterase family protein, partial [Blastocatellia bacterium]|nr:glycerophosphodiester phosphodiesterase family protein [Blastocatellia bacterium]